MGITDGFLDGRIKKGGTRRRKNPYPRTERGASAIEPAPDSKVGLGDHQKAQAIEANQHGAPLMTDDPQRQRKRKPESSADQHADDGTGENEVLHEHVFRAPRVG